MDDDNILEWQIVIMGYVQVTNRRRKGKEADQVPSSIAYPNMPQIQLSLPLTLSLPTLYYDRPADTLYEGAILRARLIFPEVSLLCQYSPPTSDTLLTSRNTPYNPQR